MVRFLQIFLLFWYGALAWTVNSSAAEFQAGFATADITPPVGWRRAGNYTELISTGVTDPLYAKVLVLAQGKTKIVIIGNDLTSVPRDLTAATRKLAAEKTGIPAEHIAITATHTHGGPEYYGPLREALHARALAEHNGTDPREPFDYPAKLRDTWVDLIARANASLQPVKLSLSVPQQLNMAYNRRFLMKDGSTGWNSGHFNPDILRPLGPVDPDLPFVLVRDVNDKPLGGLTVFAMHTAIYGGPQFGACYPGHLQIGLREQLQSPEFISIFGQGCAGDVNHLDVREGRDRQENYHASVGQTLAKTIGQAVPFARSVAPDLLAMKSKTITVPVLPITEVERMEAENIINTLDRNGKPFLTVVDAYRKMFQIAHWRDYGENVPKEVQAIRLDRDTAIVTLPHEVFVELGIAIKAGSPFKNTIVISLTNDVDYYVPTRRAFQEGNYEPTTCPLVPGCGEKLVAAALELLNEMAE
ncbi:MAG: hypothetical protein SFX18_00170 [Pirellulales bacterium]|nr:hypothetical protein [Pirellulales bacterium]